MEISSFEQLMSGQPVTLTKVGTISMDFFDTLVERKEPEIVIVERAFRAFSLQNSLQLSFQKFLLLREQAYAEVGSANSLNNKDRELTTVQWYQALLQLAGCENSDDLGLQFSQELAARETANLRLSAHAKSFLTSCVERQQRVLILSDTYYTKEQFQQFLQTLQIDKLISRSYLSCELGVNKASGKMFQHVLQTERLNSDELIHVGDNPNGDYAQPRNHQIAAFLYQPENDQELFPQNQQAIQQALYNFGADILGPLLLAFCYWLRAKLKDDQPIVFLARDSYLLFNLYRRLFPKAKCQYAYINRVLVNQFEYQELHKQTLDFVDRSYRAEGLEGLEKAFGLYNSSFSDELKIFCQRMGCRKDSLLESELMHAILQDRNLCEQFNISSSQRRANSFQYLQQIFASSESQVALIDVGWRGTIFNVLRNHLDVPMEGFLLCNVNPGQQELSAMVDEQTGGNILTILSEYRDLIEWAGSEDIGAILYIDEILQPVFADKYSNQDFAKQTVQKGVWQCFELHKSEDIQLDVILMAIEKFLRDIPGDFSTAMGEVNTELGIDGISTVSFSDMLGSSNVDTTHSASVTLQKQAMVNTFLDLVAQLHSAPQVVIYGAGSGFNFIIPHLPNKVSWVVDINSKLHGKTIQNVSIRSLNSLELVEGILLISVIGRKAQILPLLKDLSCKVIFLEDFL